MRIYMPRFFTRDLAGNLACLRRSCDEAAGLGAEALFFPEQFLTGYYGQTDLPAIREAFAGCSALSPQMLCFFGTLSEEGYNRQLVYLAGREVARYEKVHLFEPNGEQELWRSGSRYVALEHGGWRIGLCTCNDVRFPEQARALKLHCDVNMLVYPSLWPWARDHVFAALLRARAIENGAFVVGCCVAGVDNGRERFDGAGNHVFDPLGNELYAAGRIYEFDPAVLGQVLVDTRAQYREISDVALIRPPGGAAPAAG
jgi:predicted amidohydrolase